jgi:hypothetical protein
MSLDTIHDCRVRVRGTNIHRRSFPQIRPKKIPDYKGICLPQFSVLNMLEIWDTVRLVGNFFACKPYMTNKQSVDPNDSPPKRRNELIIIQGVTTARNTHRDRLKTYTLWITLQLVLSYSYCHYSNWSAYGRWQLTKKLPCLARHAEFRKIKMAKSEMFLTIKTKYALCMVKNKIHQGIEWCRT